MGAEIELTNSPSIPAEISGNNPSQEQIPLNRPPSRSTTSNSIVPFQLQQIIYLPIAFFLHLFQNITSKIKIPITTPEQDEILETMPVIQEELQKDMKQASLDQQQIGNDLKALKSRLDRLEERRRQRAKAFEQAQKGINDDAMTNDE